MTGSELYKTKSERSKKMFIKKAEETNLYLLLSNVLRSALASHALKSTLNSRRIYI
jgi:hypothetical protein